MSHSSPSSVLDWFTRVSDEVAELFVAISDLITLLQSDTPQDDECARLTAAVFEELLDVLGWFEVGLDPIGPLSPVPEQFYDLLVSACTAHRAKGKARGLAPLDIIYSFAHALAGHVEPDEEFMAAQPQANFPPVFDTCGIKVTVPAYRIDD